MDDGEPQEKLAGLALFPSVPEFEPDVDTKQTQWIRYGQTSSRAIASREGWQWAKSEKQAVAESSGNPASDGSRMMRTLSPMAHSRAPDCVTLRITSAPGCFCLPLKLKKQIKPNFRVAVTVAYRPNSGVSFLCTVKACILSESERQDLPNWCEPEDDGDPLLIGTTTISHVFDDTVGQTTSAEHDKEIMQKQRSDQSRQPSAAGASGYDNMEVQGDVSLNRQVTGGGSTQALKFMTHEFEFSGMKVTKPSRMKKVYMAFFCNVLERDALFTAYHVPTIVIAHITNQGPRALETLLGHVEGRLLDHDDGDIDNDGHTPQRKVLSQNAGRLHMQPHQQFPGQNPAWSNPGSMYGGAAPSAHSKPQAASPSMNQGTMPITPSYDPFSLQGASGGNESGRMGSGPIPPGNWAQPRSTGISNGPGSGNLGNDVFNVQGMFHETNNAAMNPAASLEPEVPLFCTREALREFVANEYESLGIVRPLTEMDIRVTEVQAGFPDTPEARRSGMQISHERWNYFQEWYKQMLKLLLRIRTVWNKTDPTAVAGFDVGRLEAMRALSQQPPGTFVIRLSLSNAGAVVLSIRREAMPGDPGVVHALIEKNDLDGRRIETWIRDFDDAIMLLDVYTGKRMSKHEIFMPEYVRLAGIDANADASRFQAVDHGMRSPFM